MLPHLIYRNVKEGVFEFNTPFYGSLASAYVIVAVNSTLETVAKSHVKSNLNNTSY